MRTGSVFKSTYETKASNGESSESQKKNIGSEKNKAKGRDGTQNFTHTGLSLHLRSLEQNEKSPLHRITMSMN